MNIPKSRLTTSCVGRSELGFILSDIKDMADRENIGVNEMNYYWVRSLLKTGIFLKVAPEAANEMLFKAAHWAALLTPKKKKKPMSFKQRSNSLSKSRFLILLGAITDLKSDNELTNAERISFEEILSVVIELSRVSSEIPGALLEENKDLKPVQRVLSFD